MWTSDNTNYEMSDIPFDAWRADKDNLEKQLCLAIALASSNRENKDAESRQIIDQVVASKPAAAIYVIAMDVAMLLGDFEMANTIVTSAYDSGARERDHRW